jgi:RNA polymerase sigma factor (sigma-70 family)
MEYRLFDNDSLLTLLKNSDELAFKEIYIRFWKEIYRVAYAKTHHKEVSEEITQNLFVDLWRRRTALSINTLECYLFGSLKYSIINHYKSQLVKDKYRVNSSIQQELGANPTDDLVLLNDLSNTLLQSIALLPKKTGEVFKLSRIDNRSTKEISQQLNISEKAVEYHITQSLKSMRFYLRDYLLMLTALLPALFHIYFKIF